MLNSSEKEILKVLKDTEYLQCLNVSIDDIEKAIKLGIKEFNELENIVTEAVKSKENFQDLCKRLKGHNETFNEKYPSYNYFDLNYKSLLVTVHEKLDKENNSIQFAVSKSGVYIYPDNISKVTTDEICILDLNEKIDFEKVKNKVGSKENSMEEEIFKRNIKQNLKKPKEIRTGIFEIIPIHRVTEGIGEVYTEYMNFNRNNGTVIYEKRFGFLTQCPDIIKISEYQNRINKRGIDNISGADEFKKFIHKYPQIYIEGINNEENAEECNKGKYETQKYYFQKNFNVSNGEMVSLDKEEKEESLLFEEYLKYYETMLEYTKDDIKSCGENEITLKEIGEKYSKKLANIMFGLGYASWCFKDMKNLEDMKILMIQTIRNDCKFEEIRTARTREEIIKEIYEVSANICENNEEEEENVQ